MTCKETITWYEIKTRPLTDEEKDQYPTGGMMVEGTIPDENKIDEWLKRQKRAVSGDEGM